MSSLVGIFQLTIDLGGGTITGGGTFDNFVAKLSGTDGSHSWSQLFGDSSKTGAVKSVAFDGSGNVIVVGLFSGSVDFGGGSLTAAGSSGIIVVKYSGSDGSHLWSQNWGGTGSDAASTVTVDGSGNIIVAGSFEGTVSLGGGALVSNGSTDIFVAKYLSDGSHQWSRSFGNTNGDEALAVAVDSSGDVLLVGNFTDLVDFGGGPLFGAGSTDIFLAKLRQ